MMFYLLGHSRHYAVCLHEDALAVGVRLICVNRPGMGATTAAPAGQRADTACDDAAACLQHLGVRKAVVLFLCAGTPYALRFCISHRGLAFSAVFGVSSWVSPADCPEASPLFRLWVSSPCAGSIASTVCSVVGTSSSLSSHSASKECGGEGEDISLLLGPAASWGVSYDELSACHLTLFHGTHDLLVPFAAAVWLRDQVNSETVTLNMGRDIGHGPWNMRDRFMRCMRVICTTVE